MIVRRYEAATDNSAVLIETGETLRHGPRVGRGKQRQSRAGSSGAFGAKPCRTGSSGAVKRARMPHRGGQRFEIPSAPPVSANIGCYFREIEFKYFLMPQ